MPSHCLSRNHTYQCQMGKHIDSELLSCILKLSDGVVEIRISLSIEEKLN